MNARYHDQSAGTMGLSLDIRPRDIRRFIDITDNDDLSAFTHCRLLVVFHVLLLVSKSMHRSAVRRHLNLRNPLMGLVELGQI